MRYATLLLLIASTAYAEVRRLALVVGSNHGEGVSAAPLRYADDDAVAMYELLTQAGVDAVLLTSPDADTLRLHPGILSQPPTLTALLEAFETQRKRVTEFRAAGDEVEWTFFFSGHGDVEHGEGFLGLEQGRLTRAVLHETLLARSGATRTHVIIDACKSALLVVGKGPGGRRLPFAISFVREPKADGEVGFLVSASSARDSHEWERVQSDVFSYELRSALRGAADADGDGIVSYAEVGAFLRKANAAIPNPAYRPDFMILPANAERGLSAAVLRWEGAAMVADVALGHVYVERPNGERVLDLNAASAFVARLFLPAERPLFVRTVDDTKELALADATSAWSTVAVAPTQTRQRGALGLAFAQLFAEPFGADAVLEFRSTYQPPDLTKLEVAESRSFATNTLKPIAGWAAIGTGVLAASMFAVSWSLHESGSMLSQSATVNRNGQLTALNVTGVVSGSIAVAAAGLWLWLTASNQGLPTVAVAPNAAGGGLVYLSGVWTEPFLLHVH